MLQGTFTALITPFKKDGKIDFEGMRKLVEFQINQLQNLTRGGGILFLGTTGESPCVNPPEHDAIIREMTPLCRGRCFVMAGTGSNNTAEAVERTQEATKAGADAVLLVDPYYNKPASPQIARFYTRELCRSVPGIMMIPYMIPGRTGGAQIKARDLRTVMDEYPGRIIGVKDATGNLENMKEVRSRCGSEIAILSGDDGMTPNTIRHQEILGSGAVSVMSNLAPAAMSKLVWALLDNDAAEAARLEEMLSPLFQVVSIKTDDGEVWPNPCSIKIMMNILGMPSGPLRPPLGRVNPKCFFQILDALKTVQYEQEVIEPIESFFGVNAKQRIDEAPGKSNNIHYPC